MRLHHIYTGSHVPSEAREPFSIEKASMKVLYVACPLLTLSEESAGGAEQMLWTLERFPHPERSEGTLYR